MCENDNNVSNSKEDWNVDDHFDPTQPPGHWILKKAFLEAHKHKYPKYRLLALANTFSNMEFMGTRYMPELEKKIRSLSKKVPEIIDYRNGRENFLKRTFVSASDATRSKRLKTKSDVPKIEITFERKNESIITPPLAKLAASTNLSVQNYKLLQKVKNQEGVRSKIILPLNQYPKTALSILNEAASKANVDFKLQRTGNMSGTKCEYVMTLGNEEIVKGFAESEKEAKTKLGPRAIELLQETCFSLMVKTQLEGQNVDKEKTKEIVLEEEKKYSVPEDNKGTKIMRLMGWNGEGLGRREDGIKKPIEVNRNVSRMGLCLFDGKDIKAIKQVVHRLLNDFANSNDTDNLVFSNDYSIEERKIIHEMSQKLNLKSKSYGKNEARQLVVSKKQNQWTIVTQLLSCGCENANYKLLMPTKIDDY